MNTNDYLTKWQREYRAWSAQRVAYGYDTDPTAFRMWNERVEAQARRAEMEARA